jgi:hypothetical protein
MAILLAAALLGADLLVYPAFHRPWEGFDPEVLSHRIAFPLLTPYHWADSDQSFWPRVAASLFLWAAFFFVGLPWFISISRWA